MKIRIAVIGQSGEISEKVKEIAIEVGKEIASKQAILLTGGRDGVMEAVSMGAKSNGGLVVGILPGDDKIVANDYIDIPITTGLSFDYRSLILVHSADAIIMISGGNGTLGELSAAYMNNKPIVVIETTGGWATRVKEIVYDGKYLDERKTVEIHFSDTAKKTVEMVLSKIN